MTKKTTPTKYKTAEGDYLTLDENRDGTFCIRWYVKDDDDYGGALGENEWKGKKPTKKSEWECWQADKAVEAMADGRDSINGFFFHEQAKAEAALAEANRCLLTGGAPWPAWAVQAREAGWTPPEGWKP